MFNYNPKPGKGHENDRMLFGTKTHNLFKDKKMATGREFGEKLATPGWFGRVTKKYYIVTIPTGQLADPTPDDFTVALIFEDPDDSSIVYNATLRNLSDRLFAGGSTSATPYSVQLWSRLAWRNVNRNLYDSLY